MNLRKKKVVIIAGPTAVGKTAAAIALAKQLGTEIISADSRQCYKELKIGVARPSPEELSEVRHHFIASHSIHEKFTASDFERYALGLADRLFQHHDQIVMVGGTGLYIKAFTEGLDEIPAVPPGIREEISREYQANGINWLQEEIRRSDPAFHEKGETQNPQRMMRALEVIRATGNSIFSFRKNKQAERDFEVIKIVLSLPKEELHKRINYRVGLMMEAGLVDEVRALIPFEHLNALQTVGYRELFDYFKGELGLQDAVELIRRNTRQYAKRQLTWFKKDPEWQWIEPDGAGLIQLVERKLGRGLS